MDKITKLTFEFKDKIKTLEGEEAEKWQKEVDSMVLLGQMHGQKLSEFKWKINKK